MMNEIDADLDFLKSELQSWRVEGRLSVGMMAYQSCRQSSSSSMSLRAAPCSYNVALQLGASTGATADYVKTRLGARLLSGT
jgi:hypothetical protein